MAKPNPRNRNGALRRKNARRLRAEGRPCWICRAFGRSGRIDYTLPAGHPMCFEIDELVPVSRYQLGGYASPEQCAADYANLAAAHRCCNEWRSNKTVDEVLSLARGEQHERERLPLPQPWEL